MEEKVQYQSDERLQDVNEVLENCQTRVSSTTLINLFTIETIIQIKSLSLSLSNRFRKWNIYLNNNMLPWRV